MERVTSATQPIIRLFHFPPFPPVPEGVKIIPFKDFREHGTRVVGEDKIERDGLGIPTIALMNKDKKKKAKSMNATMNGSLKKEWWENWEASSESFLVRGPYDPTLNRVDRFHQATTEFAKYHPMHPYQHLAQLWAVFRAYAGVDVLDTQKAAAAADEVSDDEYEDGDADSTFATQEMPADAGSPPVAQPGTSVRPETKDKTTAFLDNPAQSIKIFLSSHMHDRGSSPVCQSVIMNAMLTYSPSWPRIRPCW
ncbi:hypothetical protein B0H13DRAFT_2568768 [Mycena leptocephala]|nr:hypothetical protein B0H13DRAFT_2568768 [Mycena leptocephala]